MDLLLNLVTVLVGFLAFAAVAVVFGPDSRDDLRDNWAR